MNPVSIWYDEAIAIAVLGLFVNLASAWLLRDDHGHDHHHHHHGHDNHDHDHHAHRHDRDLNLRAA
jgi:Co/Zn/Cd efflux system component